MDSVAHAELNLCLTFGFLNSLINMVMILNSGYGLEAGVVVYHHMVNLIEMPFSRSDDSFPCKVKLVLS